MEPVFGRRAFIFELFCYFGATNFLKTKVWGAFALMTAVGVVGLWPRLPRIMQAQMRIMGALSTGDRTVQMKLGWWVLLMGISLAMSIFLFKREKSRRTILWWISLVAFIAFLPNAPYVLTDIVHLIRGISSGSTASMGRCTGLYSASCDRYYSQL